MGLIPSKDGMIPSSKIVPLRKKNRSKLHLQKPFREWTIYDKYDCLMDESENCPEYKKYAERIVKTLGCFVTGEVILGMLKEGKLDKLFQRLCIDDEVGHQMAFRFLLQNILRQEEETAASIAAVAAAAAASNQDKNSELSTQQPQQVRSPPPPEQRPPPEVATAAAQNNNNLPPSGASPPPPPPPPPPTTKEPNHRRNAANQAAAAVEQRILQSPAQETAAAGQQRPAEETAAAPPPAAQKEGGTNHTPIEMTTKEPNHQINQDKEVQLQTTAGSVAAVDNRTLMTVATNTGEVRQTTIDDGTAAANTKTSATVPAVQQKDKTVKKKRKRLKNQKEQQQQQQQQQQQKSSPSKKDVVGGNKKQHQQQSQKDSSSSTTKELGVLNAEKHMYEFALSAGNDTTKFPKIIVLYKDFTKKYGFTLTFRPNSTVPARVNDYPPIWKDANRKDICSYSGFTVETV